MKKILLLFISIFAISCAEQGVSTKSIQSMDPQDGLLTNMTGEELLRLTKVKLTQSETMLKSLEELTAKPTMTNALIPYNELLVTISEAANNANFVSNMDTDSARRDEGRKLEQAVEKFVTERIGLNAKLYKILKSVELKGVDSETRYFMEKTLRDFRRLGVDRDEKIRQKVAKLQEELTNRALEFQKNIADDVKKYELTDIKELAGLPEDYISNHKPNADGKIIITTQYPDILPIFEFASNVEFRKKMYLMHLGRGYPKNGDVLKKVIELRHELARTLGYKNWAAYNLETKMLNTTSKVRSFIDQLISLAEVRAKYDYKELLNEKRKADPTAKEVFDYEKGLYSRLLKMAKIQFDANEVRKYFAFDDVKKGVFDITSRIFGLTYKKVDGLTLWHKDVEAYDVYDGEKRLGRFYLDLFPREGKYGHAAQFTFRDGRKGAHLPQGALVCNFPNPKTTSPALMGHAEFETFLHEFGHLLHLILSGKHQWIGTTSHTGVEWDFIEAPSQFLEEWSLDYDTLAGFAKHYQTGEVIPKDLVAKLKASKNFNQGIFIRSQMFYSDLAYNLFTKSPEKINVDEMTKLSQNKISMFKYVPDSHFAYSFGHLMGYSAAYYTYMWSLVIAKDMFSIFEKNGIYDVNTAKRYRKEVLEAGSTRPIEMSMRAYLRRPLSFDSFTAWLNKK